MEAGWYFGTFWARRPEVGAEYQNTRIPDRIPEYRASARPSFLPYISKEKTLKFEKRLRKLEVSGSKIAESSVS